MSNLNSYDIERGFIDRADIMRLLDNFENTIEIEKASVFPTLLKTLDKKLKMNLGLKLKIAFQRQIQLTFDEAYQFYNANIEILNDRVEILYDILERINDMNISYVMDKLTVASYFRVDAETFDKLLVDALVDEPVQIIFRSINELILSIAQIGLESGVLNSYTWNRLQMKAKFGGQEIELHKTEKQQPTVIVATDIQRKLANDYDFTKLIEQANNSENKGA